MNLLPGGAARAGDPTDAVLIGVRPEHIVVCEPGRGLPAQLETIEYLGAESMLICRHNDAHRITVRMPGRVTAGIGERVGLVWPTDHARPRPRAPRGNMNAAPYPTPLVRRQELPLPGRVLDALPASASPQYAATPAVRPISLLPGRRPGR